MPCVRVAAAGREAYTTATNGSCFTVLPRDAMRKRGICCRLMSVRLSVTLMYPDDKDIVKLLSPSGSAIILVF